MRLLYAYPDGVTDELLDLMASEESICPYLDIPIQHIDDQILGAMNRRVSESDIRSLLTRIRSKIPKMTLRTSLIVGFPGETDAQFKKLLSFVEEGQFDRLGVFCYSREQGTPASRLSGQVPERVKLSRLKRLMKAQSRVSFKKNLAVLHIWIT